jgi:lipopolysaccharide export LptBFGC system permease protein LptF
MLGGEVGTGLRDAGLLYYMQEYHSEPPKKILNISVWIFFMNTRRKLGLDAQTLGIKTPAFGSEILFVAGERHTKKANLLLRSRQPIRAPSTPALAHAPSTYEAHRAPTTPQLFLRFYSRATHARTLLPAALASAPFGFVLVRVRAGE